jgi:hypothetical protein
MSNLLPMCTTEMFPSMMLADEPVGAVSEEYIVCGRGCATENDAPDYGAALSDLSDTARAQGAEAIVGVRFVISPNVSGTVGTMEMPSGMGSWGSTFGNTNTTVYVAAVGTAISFKKSTSSS